MSQCLFGTTVITRPVIEVTRALEDSGFVRGAIYPLELKWVSFGANVRLENWHPYTRVRFEAWTRAGQDRINAALGAFGLRARWHQAGDPCPRCAHPLAGRVSTSYGVMALACEQCGDSYESRADAVALVEGVPTE